MPLRTLRDDTTRDIDALTRKDAALYVAALTRVLGDLRDVETATSTTILCRDASARVAAEVAYVPGASLAIARFRRHP